MFKRRQTKLILEALLAEYSKLPKKLLTNFAFNLWGLNLATCPFLTQSGPALELGWDLFPFPIHGLFVKGKRNNSILLEMKEEVSSMKGAQSTMLMPDFVFQWTGVGSGAQEAFPGNPSHGQYWQFPIAQPNAAKMLFRIG